MIWATWCCGETPAEYIVGRLYADRTSGAAVERVIAADGNPFAESLTYAAVGPDAIFHHDCIDEVKRYYDHAGAVAWTAGSLYGDAMTMTPTGDVLVANFSAANVDDDIVFLSGSGGGATIWTYANTRPNELLVHIAVDYANGRVYAAYIPDGSSTGSGSCRAISLASGAELWVAVQPVLSGATLVGGYYPRAACVDGNNVVFAMRGSWTGEDCPDICRLDGASGATLAEGRIAPVTVSDDPAYGDFVIRDSDGSFFLATGNSPRYIAKVTSALAASWTYRPQTYSAEGGTQPTQHNMIPDGTGGVLFCGTAPATTPNVRGVHRLTSAGALDWSRLWGRQSVGGAYSQPISIHDIDGSRYYVTGSWILNE